MAMHIPVSVPKATVGCDICFEGPSRVKRLVLLVLLIKTEHHIKFKICPYHIPKNGKHSFFRYAW